jgi:hypothetical protein
MKFNYGHFPNGTVVTVNLAGEYWGGAPSNTSRQQLTVESLSKNGPRSYVFKSGDSIINIDYDTSIVLRGPENALQMKYAPFQATLKDVISGTHQAKKGFYFTHNPAWLLEWELGKVLHHFEEADVSKMTLALIKNGFVAIEGLGRWPVRKINKKRFRKWVKQNARRFLLNLDAEEKREAEKEAAAQNLSLGWKYSYERIANE